MAMGCHVLVVGSGGREHALAWKLAQSERVQRVYVAPGNGGTAADRRLVNVAITDPEALAQFARWRAAEQATTLRYVSVNGKASLISGTNKGAVGQINITPQTPFQLRRLNWRELQSVD